MSTLIQRRSKDSNMGLQAVVAKRKVYEDVEPEDDLYVKRMKTEDSVANAKRTEQHDTSDGRSDSESCGSSEDEEEEEEEEEEESGGGQDYQGSILASCLLRQPNYSNGMYSEDVYRRGWCCCDVTRRPANPTIQCDENGKSYLELGSNRTLYVSKGSSAAGKCERVASCYRRQRLSVLHISMCKLSRYRQVAEPSLHRSVLICNTLRHIEQEMEREGVCFPNPAMTTSPHQLETNAMVLDPPPPCPPTPPPSMMVPPPHDLPHSRNFRVAPYPPHTPPGLTHAPDRSPSLLSVADSGFHEDRDDQEETSINWSSVLSLSSQSDLDLLLPSTVVTSTTTASASPVENELDEFLPTWKLTPLSADDVLKTFPPSPVPAVDTSPQQASEDLDSLMNVLVGT